MVRSTPRIIEHMQRLPIDFTVVVCACLAACLPASALTVKTVENVISSSKVWPGGGRFAVACNDNQVIVSTYRDHAETDRDCKIDTVLILRNILKVDTDITRLTVRFYEPRRPHNYKQIEVRQSDIAAFGHNLIDDQKLLSGIGITAGYDVPEVVQGPFGEARAAAKQHIADLQTKGVGIAAYMRLFSEVEELATKADVEAKADDIAKNSAAPAADGGDANRTVSAVAGRSSTSSEAAVIGKASDATMNALRDALNALMEKLDEQERASRQLKTAYSAPRPARNLAPSGTGTGTGTSAGVDGSSKVQDLGSFSPTEGPYLLDRISIARKLSELDRQSVPIQNYKAVWRRMDANANRGLSAAVKTDVDYLFSQLGLTPISDDQRKNTTVLKVNN